MTTDFLSAAPRLPLLSLPNPLVALCACTDDPIVRILPVREIDRFVPVGAKQLQKNDHKRRTPTTHQKEDELRMMRSLINGEGAVGVVRRIRALREEIGAAEEEARQTYAVSR